MTDAKTGPDANARFVGSIPENYDRYLGPVLFEPYARDLAGRLRVKEGARVLELACGTGIVTRRLRERMPASSGGRRTPAPCRSRPRRSTPSSASSA